MKTVHWIQAPNYSCLMTGSWDKTLKFWDTRQSNPMLTLQLPERCYCADVVYPMAMVGTAQRGILCYQLENQPSEFKRIESPLKHQVTYWFQLIFGHIWFCFFFGHFCPPPPPKLLGRGGTQIPWSPYNLQCCLLACSMTQSSHLPKANYCSSPLTISVLVPVVGLPWLPLPLEMALL